MQIREPYHFVPVLLDHAVTDEPVFHDVQKTDADSWSGELQCELDALTPLIAGNYQFEHQHVVPALKLALEKLVQSRGASPNQIDTNKKWIEPFSEGQIVDLERKASWPGQVLIPGSQLKGMIRQSLQALLSSPMERVAERSYSYRPNIMVPQAHRKVEVLPVVVLGIREHLEGQELVVQPLEKPREGSFPHPVVFVNADRSKMPQIVAASSLNPSDYKANLQQLHRSANVQEFSYQRNNYVSKIQLRGGAVPLKAHGYLHLNYAGGIDGQATFSKAFNNNPGYRSVLAHVPGTFLNSGPCRGFAIPPKIVNHFFQTLRHLKDDQHGHLMKSHPLSDQLKRSRGQIQRNIRDMLDPLHWLGYLMWAEVELNEKQQPAKILTLGHHFRYRWRYRDTIHEDRDPRTPWWPRLFDWLPRPTCPQRHF